MGEEGGVLEESRGPGGERRVSRGNRGVLEGEGRVQQGKGREAVLETILEDRERGGVLEREGGVHWGEGEEAVLEEDTGPGGVSPKGVAGSCRGRVGRPFLRRDHS